MPRRAAPPAGDRRPRVLIAGGGIAAFESALALHALAGEVVSVELLAPRPRLDYRPLAVLDPFGARHGAHITVAGLARHTGARLRRGALVAVDSERRLARTRGGVILGYDVLVVAVGARPRAWLEGALTFRGRGDERGFAEVLERVSRGSVRRLVFAVPDGVAWPLPLYELALMTATQAADRGTPLDVVVVTPEPAPLAIFGARASAAVQALLDDRGITMRTATRVAEVGRHGLLLTGGEPLEADQVVTLPRLEGPSLSGVPRDRAGFIPTGPGGLAEGLDDVYAVGDATSYPVKQGGIATQHADVVAASIAHRSGARTSPAPFLPVLRATLLTGRRPLNLRCVIDAPDSTSEADTEPLWWPAGKVFGRHLAPYLALEARASSPGRIPIEADLEHALSQARSAGAPHQPADEGAST